jgi:hypothetical protein
MARLVQAIAWPCTSSTTKSSCRYCGVAFNTGQERTSLVEVPATRSRRVPSQMGTSRPPTGGGTSDTRSGNANRTTNSSLAVDGPGGRCQRLQGQTPRLGGSLIQEALDLLDELRDKRIDDLWLDHDLVGDDTIRPVVELMVRLANEGTPQNVGQVHIHSSNVGAGHWMGVELRAAAYCVVHSYALATWTRAC